MSVEALHYCGGFSEVDTEWVSRKPTVQRTPRRSSEGRDTPQLPMLRAFLAIICLRAGSDGGTLVSREPVVCVRGTVKCVLAHGVTCQ